MTDTPRRTVAILARDGTSLTAQITRLLGKTSQGEETVRQHYAHVATSERILPGNLSGIEPMNRAMRRRQGR